MSTIENAQKAIDLAKKQAGTHSSAVLALSDAESLAAQGKYADAINRAATSLAHSVGVFSQSYAQCRALLNQKV